MRLKSAEGPLAIHNGNSNDILNSPKRINTTQCGNVTNFSTNQTTTAEDLTGYNDGNEFTGRANDALNNINSIQDKVQWCNPSQRTKKRELTYNANNRNQLLNINNTLAASLRTTRHDTASSIYSESSPDDSLLDFEDVHQNVSSADASPQDEEHAFDISDSDSSEESNLSNRGTSTLQRKGIVNPNYPGFQHLAHTLDYSIKGSSDTDFTDDDFDCEPLNAAKTDANNINNNNVEEADYQIDHIDSVNRLDSVENIQKVFYDKPVFDIPDECTNGSDSETSGNSNQASDEDAEISVAQKVELNIKTEEELAKSSVEAGNIIGDFEKEVEQEFGRISLQNQLDSPENLFELPTLEEAALQELEDTLENINEALNSQPFPTKHSAKSNTEEVLNQLSSSNLEPQPVILDDTEIIQIPHNSQAIMATNICDAFLSSAQELIPVVKGSMFDHAADNRTDQGVQRKDSNRLLEEIECKIKKIKQTQLKIEEVEKFSKEDVTKGYKEKDEDSAVPRKKEKIDHHVKNRKDYNQQFGSLITFPRRELGGRNRDVLNRRSVPTARDKKKNSQEVFGGFDVYNIETAMPKIDLEAIESHLRAAREEERRRRTDREEIRRRLAMGSEDDYYSDRPGRKPSLQARLQSGMNLQICFMNETVSDTESPSSDTECPLTNSMQPKTYPKNLSPYQEKVAMPPARPATLSIGQPLLQPVTEPITETDFFAKQARLQTEARMALAQAKEMARMQMEIERQRQKKSPITEMVRNSLQKVGIPFPEEKRRLSRQILTEMNVAQLQVIVNDLHTQIETLNENLVKFLMDRDDLHMEQDSMLVDIEDLTRYLGAKEQVFKEHTPAPPHATNIPPPSPAPSSPLAHLNSTMKPHLHRIANLVKK